jgi:tol-pal system protein YbgF
MRLAALLMLCVGFGALAEAQAVPVNNAAAPADNALYELLGRVEQLQSEVQQLRGTVEEQSQTISDLQRKQSNMYSDLDSRVQALTPATPQTPAPAAQAVAPTAPPQPGAVAPPVVAGTAAAANPPAAGVSPAPVTPPTASAAESKPVTPVAAKGNEKERYQMAYETLKGGQTEQSVKMFEALLSDFPAGEFADNSQYWLAEAYKINREQDKARAAFLKVVSQYPGSSKVPDALLKLGYIEFDLQNTVKARDYLTRVTNSYPGTAAANLASKKLAQLPQQ